VSGEDRAECEACAKACEQFLAENGRLRGLIQEMLDAENDQCEVEWGTPPPCQCEWCVQARAALDQERER